LVMRKPKNPSLIASSNVVHFSIEITRITHRHL
jgi:hypothetical protein